MNGGFGHFFFLKCFRETPYCILQFVQIFMTHWLHQYQICNKKIQIRDHPPPPLLKFPQKSSILANTGLQASKMRWLNNITEPLTVEDKSGTSGSKNSGVYF